MWQIAVIATGVLSGLAQIVGKRQVSEMGAFQGGVIRDVASLIFVLVLLIFTTGIPDLFTWQAAAIFVFGIVESVSLAAYFAAQRQEMAATAVFSYPFSQLLIILMSGAFFAEWKYFDVQTTQGLVNSVALVLTFGLMIVYQGGKEKIKGKIRWSTALVLSAVIVSLSNIESKWAMSVLRYTPAQAMLYEYAGLILGGTMYMALKKQSMQTSTINILWGLLQGTLYAVSTYWYIGLLTDHPLGIASVMRRVTIVLMTVVAGLWGWGERKRLTWRQMATLILGIIIFGLVMAVNS